MTIRFVIEEELQVVDTDSRQQETPWVYESEGHRLTLYLADCIEGMKRFLHPESVDVVVTSPPYNLGIAYEQYDDTSPRSQYLEWMDSWARAVVDILCDSGSVFLNLGGKPSDPWGPFEVLFRLRPYFELQNVIHWVKSIAIDAEDVGRSTGLAADLAVGHYKPINSQRFVNDCHEYIFHLTKHGDVKLDRLAIGVPYQDKSNIRRWKSAAQDLHCRGNTWFVPYETIQSRSKERPHPATFPVKIARMCVLLHGVKKTDTVLDPFMGLGHTAVACKELGVDFVGFEIDTGYFEQACGLLKLSKYRDSESDLNGSDQLPLFDE